MQPKRPDNKPRPSSARRNRTQRRAGVTNVGAALRPARINAAWLNSEGKLNPLLIEWEEKQGRSVDSKAQHLRGARARTPEGKVEFLFRHPRLVCGSRCEGGAGESKSRIISKRWDVAPRARTLGPGVSSQFPFMKYVAALTRTEREKHGADIQAKNWKR
jgi:hypothetical protein